jgi:hypothetical protein
MRRYPKRALFVVGALVLLAFVNLGRLASAGVQASAPPDSRLAVVWSSGDPEVLGQGQDVPELSPSLPAPGFGMGPLLAPSISTGV